MTTHTLKCWPEHFGPVVEGRKRLELRLDDRDYQVGDILCLREWEPLTNAYTGAEVSARITHIVRRGEWLVAGYAALSIEVLS